jgi:hypothetical protein
MLAADVEAGKIMPDYRWKIMTETGEEWRQGVWIMVN